MRFHRSTLIVAAFVSLACADAPTKQSELTVDDDSASRTMDTPWERQFSSIDAGNQHTCAVMLNGLVRCWGANGEGQAPSHMVPGFLYSFNRVTTGTHDNTCRIRTTVECVGRNDFGQSPSQVVAQASSFKDVDAGYSHACALRYDGVIQCWGGDPETYAPPVQTAAAGAFTQVSAGEGITCALRTDGIAECPGLHGLSGENGTEFSVAPARLTRISAGRHFACGVRGNGAVVCRGLNALGQAPRTKFPRSGKFTDVSVGNEHGCALRKDGVIECWGSNASGQAPATRTAQVGWFVSVAAGAEHTCALRTGGEAECWGSNSAGQATVPNDQIFRFRGLFSPLLTTQWYEMNHIVLYSGGRTVSLRFSLGSDEGMNVLAPGHPQVAQVNCASPSYPTTGTPTTGVLSYSASTNQYHYHWSVPGEMVNTCRRFILGLTDGTQHYVYVRFTTHPVAIAQVTGSLPETSPPLLVMPQVKLQARDLYGVGIAGKDVTFEVVAGGGSVAAAVRTTDYRGFVVVPTWTLGPPGLQTLRATLTAESGTLTKDLTVTALPGAPVARHR